MSGCFAWKAGGCASRGRCSCSGALATPFVTIIGHMFKVVSEVNLRRHRRAGPSTALCVVLLVAAACDARSDRGPVAWLMARPDRWVCCDWGIVVSGLPPLLVGLWRLPFLALNMGTDAAWILSTAMATHRRRCCILSDQRSRGLLIERSASSGQQAEAERGTGSLADNAVDIVVPMCGNRVAWIFAVRRPALSVDRTDLPIAFTGRSRARTGAARPIHREAGP